MNYFHRLIIFFIFVSPCSFASALSEEEKIIISHIDQEMPRALALLEKTVNINSGTLNQNGIKQVGRLFMDEFQRLGFQTDWIDLPPELNRAGHLFAHQDGKAGKKILLIGHLDTVFSQESTFQHAAFQGDRATGPGILDMKSGDVAIVYALRALQAAGVLDNAQITVALTGDEESAGRPTSISRAALIEAAKKSDVALEFEFGGIDMHQAVIARRGVGRWQLEVSAKSGHSSKILSGEFGGGAIFGAANILSSFYYEMHDDENLSFNPGVILGGSKVDFQPQQSEGTASGKENIIASKVVVQGDMRFMSDEQEATTRQRMIQISQVAFPGVQATMSFIDGYPAMAPTKGNIALLNQLNQVSIDLGLGQVSAFPVRDRGASDVSFVADYVDALGGLGATGAGAHSEQECMDLKSYPDIIKRAAILLYRLTR